MVDGLSRVCYVVLEILGYMVLEILGFGGCGNVDVVSMPLVVIVVAAWRARATIFLCRFLGVAVFVNGLFQS